MFNFMEEVESAEGFKKKIDCIGCAMQRGEIESVGGEVAETENFEVHQDYEIPIEGFMILSSKRHVEGIEGFSEEERKELVEFIFRIRKAMRESLGIQHIYLIQEEDSSSHFHIWIFPRHDWMKKFGKGIETVRPIMEHARENMKTEEQITKLKEASDKIRKML